MLQSNKQPSQVKRKKKEKIRRMKTFELDGNFFVSKGVFGGMTFFFLEVVWGGDFAFQIKSTIIIFQCQKWKV